MKVGREEFFDEERDDDLRYIRSRISAGRLANVGGSLVGAAESAPGLSGFWWLLGPCSQPGRRQLLLRSIVKYLIEAQSLS